MEGAAEIEKGIYIVPHSNDKILERAKHTHMCVIVDDKVQYDDLKHEQTIVFQEADGMIAYDWLKEIMGDRSGAFHSGKVIRLE